MNLRGIERHIRLRHAFLRGKRVRKIILLAVLSAFAGALAGWAATAHIREAAAAVGLPVRLTADEARLLMAHRLADRSSLQEERTDHLVQRLSVPADTLRLASMIDQLPRAAASETDGWVGKGNPGMVGAHAAIVAMIDVLARQAPEQRVHVAELLKEFGRSTSELRSLLIWAALLPEADRDRLSRGHQAVLSSAEGRAALLMLAGASEEQIAQCREAAGTPPRMWRPLMTIAAEATGDLDKLLQIVKLTPADRRGLFDIISAHRKPSANDSPPYPCLDHPKLASTGRGSWVSACTVALSKRSAS